jgi:PPK2 family polyphosphate:nucleotide phosphotransferase
VRNFDQLRCGPGGAALSERDPASALGLDRAALDAGREAQREVLSDLQTRLAAEAQNSVLLVLQGLDTSGKDTVIRRVFASVNPLGLRITSFKSPSDLERSHHYLWRISAALPRRGEIGIFNRSHYEDLVTASVLGTIDRPTQQRRIADVIAFESTLAADGEAVVKVFLHLSKDEQRARLQARVDDPTKRWKFNPSDLETRRKWDTYHEEYDGVLRATSTEVAPWFVVPADRKWVRDHVVTELMIDALRSLDPHYPVPTTWDPATTVVE